MLCSKFQGGPFMIRVAGAPVSFGVFELQPEEGVELIEPDDMCRILREEDYTGIDLGPIGYLGRDEVLRERLKRHELELAGGWVDLPFSDDEAFANSLGTILETILDVFIEAADGSPEMLPLPTMACRGSDIRRAHPGGGEEFALTNEQWKPFADNVMEAANLVRARGLEPAFHHHACTFVETPAEIDELLERTDIGLTFDTGHLILGGGDPLTGWHRWRERINHLRLKDARVAVLDGVVKGQGDMHAVWAGRAFVPFGEGDLEFSEFMDAVIASAFDGWLIVEQDTIPRLDDDPNQIRVDHHTNREALRTWL